MTLLSVITDNLQDVDELKGQYEEFSALMIKDNALMIKDKDLVKGLYEEKANDLYLLS